MAELEADPVYQAEMQELERQREEHFAKIREDAEPLVADLRAAGWEVEFVWDFVMYPGDYSSAYPILVEHLKRPYMERTRDGIARALTVPDAFQIAWEAVRDEFLANTDTKTTGFKYALGNALAQLMDEPVIPEVLDMVTDKRHGRNRAPMIEILVEYRDRDDVRQVLEALAEDPEVAKEAKHALALRRVRRRPGRKKQRKKSRKR